MIQTPFVIEKLFVSEKEVALMLGRIPFNALKTRDLSGGIVRHLSKALAVRVSHPLVTARLTRSSPVPETHPRTFLAQILEAR